MSLKRETVLWSAPPHTIAKISILQSYLSRWFEIFGRTHPGKSLWYIDGFAGPGEYTNSPTGSPVAAIASASAALQNVGAKWWAGDIQCVFIEQDANTFLHLQNKLNSLDENPKIQKHLFNSSCEDGLDSLHRQKQNPFSPPAPLFAFIDPFGVKGIPFRIVKDLLSRDKTEILINFDSDGIGRIFKAEEAANCESNLNEIFGDDSWKVALKKDSAFHELILQALDLYKRKLRALPGVKYVFAFEMRSTKDNPDYHLVFASQHFLGLEKMKEAMKAIDKNGTYSFSDAHIGQESLFKFNDPESHGDRLFKQFNGKTVKYDEVRDYALNESPFGNPKTMLKYLEEKGMIQAKSRDPKRRKGTFNEDNLEYIMFLQGS